MYFPRSISSLNISIPTGDNESIMQMICETDKVKVYDDVLIIMRAMSLQRHSASTPQDPPGFRASLQFQSQPLFHSHGVAQAAADLLTDQETVG